MQTPLSCTPLARVRRAARWPWLLSWTFTHTIFALHYAHDFDDDKRGRGLAFPGGEDPDYWEPYNAQGQPDRVGLPIVAVLARPRAVPCVRST